LNHLIWKKRFHRRDSSLRAFTTLELVIIVAILVAAMSIGYPSFQRYYANGNLRAAARDIVDDFAGQNKGP
jgi:Tfp pilus assembly protein FimT